MVMGIEMGMGMGIRIPSCVSVYGGEDDRFLIIPNMFFVTYASRVVAFTSELGCPTPRSGSRGWLSGITSPRQSMSGNCDLSDRTRRANNRRF